MISDYLKMNEGRYGDDEVYYIFKTGAIFNLK
jgi:hypothetical protein